ncbi:transposase [Streptomyces iakyrus]|uniref:IS110 family transposase n=1 Tax=Streptomyces iakyrus TaxID=68219 RepID=UPI0033BC9F0C
MHARSVVACTIDTVTGELIRCRLTPQHADVLGWINCLPGPATEAGPTGPGLARALSVAGIRFEVLAPSRLQRPAGERVKTDARDALHLAKQLRPDEFTAVRVPSPAEEAARDLVRAREDVRGDLMRARMEAGFALINGHLVPILGSTSRRSGCRPGQVTGGIHESRE